MNNTMTSYDDFLSDEYDEPCAKAHSENHSLVAKIKNIASVSEVLRIFGACAVIASMSLFLLNGWSEGNDIQRYLKLLTQTGLLTGAGIALSLFLKENKGARLCFGLSLISVVANFTILGALTYSMFQLDGNLANHYPSMVTWKAVSASTFWPVFAGAIALLSILTRFSFGIFARSIAGPLSLNFLAMSALLLIPVRSSLTVSIIAVAALWASAALVKKLSQNDKVVFTNETKFALGLMFVPGLLIIGRAFSLYHVDEVMLITVSGLLYFALRAWVDRFNKPSMLQRATEKVQFLTGVFWSIQVTQLLPRAIDDISGVVFAVLVIGLSFDQIRKTRDLRWQQLILNITTVGLVVLNIILALTSNGILVQAGSLVVCALLLGFASFLSLTPEDNRFSKVTAIVGVLICVCIFAAEFFALLNLGNWVVVGLIGMAFIIAGSLYERFGLSFTSRKK